MSASLSLATSILLGAASSGGSLPQLNDETFASQLFWLALTFGILYAAISNMVIPRIRHALERRQMQIDQDLSSAEKARDDAQKARALYEQELEEAKANAMNTMAAAQKEADAHHVQSFAQLEQKIAKQMLQSEAAIQSISDDFALESKSIAAELAQQIVISLSPVTISKADAQAAVNQVMEAA